MQDVLAEVQRQSGKHFDPAIVAALFESRCYEAMLEPMVEMEEISVAQL